MEASIVERTSEIEPEEAAANAASFVMRTESVIIQPVPYAGDEQVTIHDYQPFIDGDFWINKPA